MELVLEHCIAWNLTIHSFVNHSALITQYLKLKYEKENIEKQKEGQEPREERASRRV